MCFVIPVCDVDALVARYWMRVDGLGRRNTVLPFLLHLCMHHQQRVVRKMNSNLALGISNQFGITVVVFGHNPAYAEFPRHTER